MSPVLRTSPTCGGEEADVAISAGEGMVAIGLLALVGSGDWLLASIFFVVGRIGFGASLIFSDALLPHIARAEDQNRVSSLGYAMGYVGGGILLAVNAAMILFLGEIPGLALVVPERGGVVGGVHHPRVAPGARAARGDGPGG